jgi:prepilin-type N-terminal cleavage/methylation domain-containing protein
MSQDGFSLVEALMALLIFSIAAVGLAQTLVVAQKTRHTSALAMEASQLAVSELERMRAGLPGAGAIKVGPFSCATVVEAIVKYPVLSRVRVRVDWIDREPRRLELATLISSSSPDE